MAFDVVTPSHWNVSHTLPVSVGAEEKSFAGQIRPKNVKEKKLEHCNVLAESFILLENCAYVLA